MKIPPDGMLPPITSSKLNTLCDIMIVKIPDEFKKPGETTYQLASINPFKKSGMAWPADDAVCKMVSQFEKLQTCDKGNQVLQPNKKLSAPFSKMNHSNPKSFKKRSQTKYDFTGKPKPNIASKKYWWNKSNPDHNRPQKVVEIDPWVQKPWESRPYFYEPYVPIREKAYSTTSFNRPMNKFSFQKPRKGLLGDYPLGIFRENRASSNIGLYANSNSEFNSSAFFNEHSAVDLRYTETCVDNPFIYHSYENNLKPGRFRSKRENYINYGSWGNMRGNDASKEAFQWEASGPMYDNRQEREVFYFTGNQCSSSRGNIYPAQQRNTNNQSARHFCSGNKSHYFNQVKKTNDAVWTVTQSNIQHSTMKVMRAPAEEIDIRKETTWSKRYAHGGMKRGRGKKMWKKYTWK